MKIAILGGGNGSLAGAGDFALAGHDVHLWRRNPEDVAEHAKRGDTITVRDGKGTHEGKLALVTSDIAEALEGVELILCPIPAPAHADLATVIAPHLKPGMVIYLPPGTLGTMILANAAREAGTLEGVAFAETGTLPWLVRKHDFSEVVISTRAVRLPTGVYPVADTDRALKVIDTAFPGVIERCEDVLSAALMNAGAIIHSPLIMMNAAPLEHFEAWDIHNEGTQSCVRTVTDQLDAERIAVREAFGYGAPHFPLADYYRDDSEMWMYDREARANLTDSGDWREKIDLHAHRYMMEDTRLGLSLICSMAEVAGIDVPVARALMTLGGVINHQDFMQTGRPLSAVGLGGLSMDELKAKAEGPSA